MSIIKIISGVVSAFLIFVVLGVDYFILGGQNEATNTYVAAPWAFSVLVLVLLILSQLELYSMFEKRGMYPLKVLGLLLGGMFLLFSFMGPYSVEPVSRYGSAPLVWLKDVEHYWDQMSVFVLILGIVMPLLYFLFTKKKEHALESSMATTFGLIYVVILGSFMLKIRFQSIEYIFLFVCTAKGGDIGAYFTGSGLGRHSLHPESPNKTIEGSLGGIIVGTLVAVGITRVLLQESFPIYLAVIYGLLVTVMSQLGDLGESLIKRRCGVKDSGSMIPGSGGMLDFVDCLLFSAPAAYYFGEFIAK